MPSGPSFSTSSTSPWKYLSFENDRARIAPIEPIPRYALYRSPWWTMTSPGASSVPASSDPAMIVSAPAAIAFATSPDEVMPPSAMIGTSTACAAS
jgi:uncharacterized protein (DUF2345 family)